MSLLPRVTRWQCMKCLRRLAWERAKDGSDPQVCVVCRATDMFADIGSPGIPLYEDEP